MVATVRGMYPEVFRVASGNMYLGLVEFPLDLFVFLYPELNQFLCVARIDAYGPTGHRPADAAGLGHAPLVNSTSSARHDRLRSS